MGPYSLEQPSNPFLTGSTMIPTEQLHVHPLLPSPVALGDEVLSFQMCVLDEDDIILQLMVSHENAAVLQGLTSLSRYGLASFEMETKPSPVDVPGRLNIPVVNRMVFNLGESKVEEYRHGLLFGCRIVDSTLVDMEALAVVAAYGAFRSITLTPIEIRIARADEILDDGGKPRYHLLRNGTPVCGTSAWPSQERSMTAEEMHDLTHLENEAVVLDYVICSGCARNVSIVEMWHEGNLTPEESIADRVKSVMARIIEERT